MHAAAGRGGDALLRHALSGTAERRQEWTCGARKPDRPLDRQLGPRAANRSRSRRGVSDGPLRRRAVRRRWTVTPAVAGPFNLGYVNVRSTINVNPDTAQATITVDPGPRNEGLPTILKGVPVQLKQRQRQRRPSELRVQPHQLHAEAVTATLTGSQGAKPRSRAPSRCPTAPACPSPPSSPPAHRATAAKPTATAFTVKVTSSPGQANIAKIDLTIPGGAALAPDDDPESLPGQPSSKPTRRPVTKAPTSATRPCTRRC